MLMKHYFSDIRPERSSFLLLVWIKVQLEVFITCFRAPDNKRGIFWTTTALFLFGAVSFSCRPSNTTDLSTCSGCSKGGCLTHSELSWGVCNGSVGCEKIKNFLDINAYWYKRCHIKLLQSQQVNICADILSWKAVISSSAHTLVPGFWKHTHCVQVCAYMDFCIILQPLEWFMASVRVLHTGSAGCLQDRGTLSSGLWELPSCD